MSAHHGAQPSGRAIGMQLWLTRAASSVDAHLFGLTPEGEAVQRVVLSRPGRARDCRPHLRCDAAGDRPARPSWRGTEHHPRLREHRRLLRARRTLTSGRPLAGTRTASPGARLDIDGTRHGLSRNEGEHHLHGGHAGFDKKVWEIRRLRLRRRAEPRPRLPQRRRGRRAIRAPLTSKSSTRSCM